MKCLIPVEFSQQNNIVVEPPLRMHCHNMICCPSLSHCNKKWPVWESFFEKNNLQMVIEKAKEAITSYNRIREIHIGTNIVEIIFVLPCSGPFSKTKTLTFYNNKFPETAQDVLFFLKKVTANKNMRFFKKFTYPFFDSPKISNFIQRMALTKEMLAFFSDSLYRKTLLRELTIRKNNSQTDWERKLITDYLREEIFK